MINLLLFFTVIMEACSNCLLSTYITHVVGVSGCCLLASDCECASVHMYTCFFFLPAVAFISFSLLHNYLKVLYIKHV